MAQFDALATRYKEERKALDSRAALVARTIANAHRDPEQRPNPYTLDDFMPQEPKPRVEMTAEEIAQSLRATTMILGGEEK
jgi:hypothetical protein